MGTYVKKQDKRDAETRKSDTVADLLEEWSGGSKSGGSNIASAVVVHNHTNGDVGNSDDGLANDQGLSGLSGVAHLRSDREEAGGSSVGEDKRRASSDSLGEGRVSDNLEIRLPVAVAWRGC